MTLLLDRLPENHSHRKFLEIELHRTAAGIRGEKRIQDKFNEFYMDEEFHVLWNVNLKINNWKVQMDGLLLTNKCALIIEPKNISGKIHFDRETGEFYRFDDEGEKMVLEDPTVQLEKHIRFLTMWFKTKKINLPVGGLVIFTSKQCEFISKPPEKHICKTYQMNQSLYRILENYPAESHSPKLAKIKKLIETNQTSYKQIPLCGQYHIKREDLKTGVYCQKCNKRSMQRIRKSWNCAICGHRDSEAHHYTVREYFSIVAVQLNSQQFRQFCQIESIFVASRMLAKLELVISGEKKNRHYELKE